MSQTRLAPRPAPRPAARPGPHRGPAPLRLVGPPRRRRRGLTRLATALAATLAAVGMFAVVALHVFLAQGQVDLDRIQKQADAETARNGRLKVAVAQLESPERLAGAARDRLGMVPPATVVYLPAADPKAALPPVPDAPLPTTSAKTGTSTPTTVARTTPTTAKTRTSTPTTVARTTPTTVRRVTTTTPTGATR